MSLKQYSQVIFCLFLIVPVDSFSQPGFDFLLWNKSGGLIEQASPVQVTAQLDEHWHTQLLPSMLSVQLSIHVPKTDSLQYFQLMIDRIQPFCIEGDPAFVELVVNAGRQQKYIPILQMQTKHQAELVFRSPAPNWEGTLGVVHPSYNPGGRLQIQHWEQETGFRPETVSFDSIQETLLHLMVGSVQAAAVPNGVLDAFLREQNRMELVDRFYRIHIRNPLPTTMIYLRQDWYENIMRRTLISETWLRDRFPAILQNVFQPVSYL